MSYLPLLVNLKGKPVQMEVGHPCRQSVEIVHGFLWDILFENTIALVLMSRAENVAKLDAQNKPIMVNNQAVFNREILYYFKWVLVQNIVSVESDANVKIVVQDRKLSRGKDDPLYTDNFQEWSKLNNGLSKAIDRQLAELGVQGLFEGVYRDDENNPIAIGEEPPAKTPGEQLVPPPTTTGA